MQREKVPTINLGLATSQINCTFFTKFKTQLMQRESLLWNLHKKTATHMFSNDTENSIQSDWNLHGKILKVCRVHQNKHFMS